MASSFASLIVLSASLLTARAWTQINPTELLRLSVAAADKTLHYGPDPLQFGELRLPKGNKTAPLVIMVHGGCWVDRLPGADLASRRMSC